MTCRLIVRRVRRLQPLAGDGSEQGELFATYRHHAFITNSDLDTIEADQRHRGHAVVEQVIAELKDGPLAHLPSGKYAANAAWVAMATIAFNIARAAAVAANMATARWATLRRRIINVPARIASTGRRLILHLPAHWAWAHGLDRPPHRRDRTTTGHRVLTTQPPRARTEEPDVEEPAQTGSPTTPKDPLSRARPPISDHSATSVDQGSADGRVNASGSCSSPCSRSCAISFCGASAAFTDADMSSMFSVITARSRQPIRPACRATYTEIPTVPAIYRG